MKATFIFSSILTLQLLLIHSQVLAQTADYTLRFDSTWSRDTHPTSFPGGAHYSGLIGATHKSADLLWSPGELASPGIKRMAELGSKFPLTQEIEDAIDQGDAGAVISSPGLGRSPGEVQVSFTVNKDFPLVTVVSMIAPSPDWFVGVNGLSLIDENGDFKETFQVELFAWDAGTDSGVTYTSLNQATEPPEAISSLLDTPFSEGVPLGTFTFILDEIAEQEFKRGDFDVNGETDLSDAILILEHLFLGSQDPNCMKAIDVDDSGELNITDPIRLLSYLFLGKAAPSSPFEECGVDETEDSLTCSSFTEC